MTGAGDSGLRVREAEERDLPAIMEIFQLTYGKDYLYQGFYDEWWLKRSVFSDDILMLVAEDDERVLGTGSVVFDIGAHSDLIGEFGRLAVHPEARGRGVGKRIMEQRVALARPRLHVAIVENRTSHTYSQRISTAFGFAPVGFLPLKHTFAARESIALYVQHFGSALRLRNNHPRIVPEAHALAHLALASCGLEYDCIVDENSAPYPGGEEFALEELTAEGLPSLLRIERGRIRNREVFGPMRLQYGFFQLTARQATYLVAREGGPDGPVAGAVGFIRDDPDHALRVFELIACSDHAIPFLFARLLERCRWWGMEYVEVDVSAHAPRMQRTLLELGFLPAAYVPAMVFHEVERFDVIKMAKLLVPPDLPEVELMPQVQRFADEVLRSFRRQAVLPQIEEALHRIAIFEGLNQEQANRLAGVCTVTAFEPGQELFQTGQEAGCMFVPLEGTVAVDLGDPPRRVGNVGAGDVVGEVSLLTGEPHSATVTAERSLRAACLARDALRELTRQRPDIAVVLYRNLACGLGRKLRRVDASVALEPRLE